MQNIARQLPSISISLPISLPVQITSIVTVSNTSLPISDTSTPPSTTVISTPPISIPSSEEPPLSTNTSTSLPTSTSLEIKPTTIVIVESNIVSLPPSATVTENITTIITSIHGQVTTFTSHLPTSLVDSTPNTSSSPRIAIISGVTAGSIILLCLALAGVFGYRRHKLRKTLAVSNQKKEGKGLLDGEEFDDDDIVPIRSYQDQYLASGASPIPRSVSPAPSLIRSRISETGSIFREEIWPPPGFIDPIEKQSSQVDLSRIVDDVMGPSGSKSTPGLPSSSSPRSGHDQFGSIGSSYSGYSHSNLPSTSHERDMTAGSTSAYSQLSIKSTTPLLSTTSDDRPIPSPPSLHTDPFASQNDSPSVYYPSVLPPGALAPTTPGQSPSLVAQVSRLPADNLLLQGSALGQGPGSPQMPTDPSNTRSVSPGPGGSRLHVATQPKKSSPLARVLTGDAKIWLGRSTHSPK